MGFVCNGRYVLKPVSAENAERYVDLQLDCLEQTYSHIIDPDFGARQRTERDSWIREFRENVSVAGARAFLAYEVPGWTPEGGLSCAVGSAVDWDSPVGLVLSRPGPLAWELELPVEPMPEGSRELTQLYTLARTHGAGLGQALFDAVLQPGEPAYLWYIMGNERAVRFYEKNGFVVEGVSAPCGGSWASTSSGKVSRTARMRRL